MPRMKKTPLEIEETTADAVIIYTAEERELALKKKVTSEVKKLPVVDKKLAELKKKYAGLKIDGIEDKKGLAEIKDGIRALTSFRTSTEKACGVIAQDYKDIVKGISEEAKRIISVLSDIEQPLRDEKAKYEQELEAEKKRKEDEKKKKLDDRIASLKESGLTWDGSFYTLGNISVDLTTIEKMADDKFIVLKAKVKDEFDRIEIDRIETERIREEERVKAKKEIERQEAEKKKLEEERLILEKEAAAARLEIENLKKEAQAAKDKIELEQKQREEEAKKLKLEQEEKIRRMQEDALAKEKELIRQNIEAKAALIGYKLEAIGLRRVGDTYDYFDNVINSGVSYDIKEAINLRSDEELTAVVDTLSISMQRVKDARSSHDTELENKRKHEQELARLEKEKIEAEKEALRLAAMPDVERVNKFVRCIEGAIIDNQYTLSNEQMQKQFSIANAKLTEILSDLKKSVNAFVN